MSAHLSKFSAPRMPPYHFDTRGSVAHPSLTRILKHSPGKLLWERDTAESSRAVCNTWRRRLRTRSTVDHIRSLIQLEEARCSARTSVYDPRWIMSGTQRSRGLRQDGRQAQTLGASDYRRGPGHLVCPQTRAARVANLFVYGEKQAVGCGHDPPWITSMSLQARFAFAMSATMTLPGLRQPGEKYLRL